MFFFLQSVQGLFTFFFLSLLILKEICCISKYKCVCFNYTHLMTNTQNLMEQRSEQLYRYINIIINHCTIDIICSEFMCSIIFSIHRLPAFYSYYYFYIGILVIQLIFFFCEKIYYYLIKFKYFEHYNIFVFVKYIGTTIIDCRE